MPNWTYNKLVFRTDADLDAICECMRGDDDGCPTDFDFNRIVEQPKELLELTCHGGYGPDATDMADVAAFAATEIGHACPLAFDEVAAWLKRRYPKTKITGRGPSSYHPAYPTGTVAVATLRAICDASQTPAPAADAEHGRAVIDVLVTCGTTEIIEWRYANWNVKWNASDVDVDRDARTIRFRTPWSDVCDLMSQMCEKFHVEAYYAFVEEQVEAYFGQYWFNTDGEAYLSDTPDDVDVDAFCMIADILDPGQDDMRWDTCEERIVYRENDDEEPDKFDQTPRLGNLMTGVLDAFLDGH